MKFWLKSEIVVKNELLQKNPIKISNSGFSHANGMNLTDIELALELNLDIPQFDTIGDYIVGTNIKENNELYRFNFDAKNAENAQQFTVDVEVSKEAPVIATSIGFVADETESVEWSSKLDFENPMAGSIDSILTINGVNLKCAVSYDIANSDSGSFEILLPIRYVTGRV